MSSRVKKMSMMYGRDGVGLHVDYVREWAVGCSLQVKLSTQC